MYHLGICKLNGEGTKMLTKEMLLDFIKDNGACNSGVGWFEEQDATPEEIYNAAAAADEADWEYIDWLCSTILKLPDEAHDAYCEAYDLTLREHGTELWRLYLIDYFKRPWSEIEAAILERMKEAQADD